MPLVFACIAPHGGNLIPQKGEITPHLPASRAAMAVLAEELQAARPETLAVLTPHGTYLDGAITLGISPEARGELDERVITTATDLDFAADWAYSATEQGVPVVPFLAPDAQPLPLDWGVTIPFALLTPGIVPLPALVVACPGRGLTRAQLVAWGEAFAAVAEAGEKRVGLIVSADQGHGHAADGPYGFAPESASYDRAMIQAIQENDLDQLLDWDAEWIDSALADSYWQTLALIGAARRIPLQPRFLSYEVDHYFGLLCAAFSIL